MILWTILGFAAVVDVLLGLSVLWWLRAFPTRPPDPIEWPSTDRLPPSLRYPRALSMSCTSPDDPRWAGVRWPVALPPEWPVEVS